MWRAVAEESWAPWSKRASDRHVFPTLFNYAIVNRARARTVAIREKIQLLAVSREGAAAGDLPRTAVGIVVVANATKCHWLWPLFLRVEIDVG
jgi:hypothetical protein